LKIISILFVVLSGPLFANIAIPNNSFPGGIAVIDFLTSHSKPQAFYNNVPLFVQKIRNNQWQAFVGIPLLTELGEKEITVRENVSFETPYYDVFGHTVWGATAMMLSELEALVNP